MGNLKEQDWDTLWHSAQAEKVREQVRQCDRNCWMIGSASPAIQKHIVKAGIWVLDHKLLKRNKYSVFENKFIKRP